MIKFTIGDKVKVINIDNSPNQLKYLGKIGIVQDNDSIPFVKFDDGKSLVFNQNRLELVPNQSHTMIGGGGGGGNGSSIIFAHPNSNRQQGKYYIKTELLYCKNFYNLSQDEIDAIIKEVQEEQKQQQLTFPNGGSITFHPTPSNQPFFISPDNWKLPTEPNGNMATPQTKTCAHEMVKYTGLFETYNYCKKCGDKEK
jgi:hypothetical protein